MLDGHTCPHVYTPGHIQTDPSNYTHTYKQYGNTCTHSRVYVCTHTRTYSHTHTYVHVYTHPLVPRYVHKRTRTHMHTPWTCTHLHTHMGGTPVRGSPRPSAVSRRSPLLCPISLCRRPGRPGSATDFDGLLGQSRGNPERIQPTSKVGNVGPRHRSCSDRNGTDLSGVPVYTDISSDPLHQKPTRL